MWLSRRRASKRAETVEAQIRYLRDASVPPRFHTDDPSQRAASLVEHDVRFHDLRQADEAPSMEREGFTMLPHRSEVTDFGDARQHAVYCRELEQLLREMTGAPMVFLSPTVVLRSRNHPRYSEGVIADRVADVVHCDRTDRSVWLEARRALQHYGLDTLPEGRLISYNLWR